MENAATPLENIFQKKARPTKPVPEPEKIKYIIAHYIEGRPLHLKADPEIEIHLKAQPSGQEEVYEIITKTPYRFPQDFTLFVTLKRHAEIQCQVVEQSETTTRVRITEIDLASSPRSAKRVDVKHQDVFGHKFLISSNNIDINPMTYSISNQVIFHEFEKKMQAQFPGIRVTDMNPASGEIIKRVVKKHEKGLIWNAQKDQTREDYLTLEDALGGELDTIMKEFRTKGIKSWIVRPIFYRNLSGKLFPIGYFEMKSTDPQFDEGLYDALQEWEQKIIDRIIDSNTVLIEEKQKIWNISENGVLMKITNEALQQYIENHREFTFDLLFRYQAGLRFHGTVSHIFKTSDGNLLVGVSFTGVVYSGFYQGPKSKKVLLETLKYLVEQGAPVY